MKRRLFLLLVCILLLSGSREPPWGDAHVVYDTTQSLVDHFRLDVSTGGPLQFYAVQNGKKYGVFPLGNVVALAPSYLAFKVMRLVPHAPAVEDLIFRFTCHFSATLLVAGVCVLFFTLARREGASERTAFWLTLVLGTCTILVIYARVLFSEALQTLAITWVAERGLTLGDRLEKRGAAYAGLALGLLVNTKLVYVLVIPALLVYVIVRHRHDLRLVAGAIAAAAVPMLALFAFALWHNHLKTGSYFDSGYKIPEGVFSGDAYAGLFGLLLSPGKSIFLYSPPIVLGFLALPSYYRRNRAHAAFLIALASTVILMDSKFRYWHADYCWGPRLLVPLTPIFLLPAAHFIAPALRRGQAHLRTFWLGALVGAGLLVQILGASFYWDHYIRIAIAVKDQTSAAGWFTEDLHHCHFIPQFSPLVGHAWLLRHTLRGDPNLLDDAPFRRVINAPVNLTAEWQTLRPDYWIADWMGTPGARIFGVALIVLLSSLLLYAAAGLRQRLRDAETDSGPDSDERSSATG